MSTSLALWSANAAAVGLDKFREAAATLSSATPGSYIEASAPARVEPTVLVDQDILFNDMTHDVLQTLLSLFSGFYLQAVALTSNIGSVSVRKQLDRLNPQRDLGANMAWSLESYKEALPGTVAKSGLVMEADEANMTPRDAAETLSEAAALSVGRLLNVEISDGEKKGNIPVTVRLMTYPIPTASLIHTLSPGNIERTWKERWHGWKSGKLSFINDMILCKDLIDDHRRGLMKDKDGAWSKIVERNRKNVVSGLLSGQQSLGAASNMVVMSEATATKLEIELNGALKDYKTRQKVFDRTSLMIMVVVDPSWNRATFYYRGMDDTTSLDARDLKTSGRNSGPDIMDILKAYQRGAAPAL